MNLIKVNSDQTVNYPYSIQRLREDNPNTSFPDNMEDNFVLNEYRLCRVIPVPHSANPYVKYTENTPVLIDEAWYQSWSEKAMTEEEIAIVAANQWASVRSQRNRLLLESDWTQLADSPLDNELKQKWTEYRQQLRNVAAQTDPFNIIWPIKP